MPSLPRSLRLRTPKVAGPVDRREVVENSDKRLVRTVRDYLVFAGHGQEMGREADGPEVNRRRGALSALYARHGEHTADMVPARRRVGSDLLWIRDAERQPVSMGRDFDFAWSTNPMSTPAVLDDLAKSRAARAEAAAATIKADPTRPFDASDDGITCHLYLDDPDLRANVLADTLLQLRAKRRSSQLMDRTVAPNAADLRSQTEGRIGSSGVVAAFEQRMALSAMPKDEDLASRRERALMRLIVPQQCGGSVNALYEARNTVAILPDYLGDDVFADPIADAPGLNVPLYHAIHQQYSANTPRAVDYYVRELAFTGGDQADRIDVLKHLVEAGSATRMSAAKHSLERLRDRFGYEVPGAFDATDKASLVEAIAQHLRTNTKLEVLREDPDDWGMDDASVIKTHELLLVLHRATNTARPTADELELELPYARRAEPAVAALIHAMRNGSLEAQIEAVGAARKALAAESTKAKGGFDRQMLVKLDRKVELMSTEILGAALDKLQDEDSLVLRLLAARSALRGVVASNLEALRGRAKTAPTEDLGDLLEELDTTFASGSVTPEDARALLIRINRSATEVGDAIRIFMRRREAGIHFGGVDVELDPYAVDGLIKETPLHYLLGLCEVGGGAFPDGARVLSSTGPRVYKRILVAENVEELKTFAPTANDLCVVESAKEKQLVFGGGLILDAADAGPGYSHASVFAKGHGISAIALPELEKSYSTQLRALGDQEIYVDDRPGSFNILGLSAAIDQGLVAEDGVDAIRPGVNRTFSYFDVEGVDERRLVKQDEVHPFADREVRPVELFVPDLENELGLGTAISFDELAKLSLDRSRQLAGEKGTVLSRMLASPDLKALGVKVPDGAVVPPYVVADLLRKAGVLDKWTDASKDLDPSRAPKLQAQVTRALSKLLLKAGRPTPDGKAILKSLESHPSLSGRTPWILRSSFTGEDRPNKSAAGQYDSFPNALSAKQRIDGLIGVIASAWNEGAVRTNQEMGIDQSLIWPAIVVQPCLDAQKSGVAVSRGDNDAFGEVSYQAKRGYGGGVDGGPAEEGFLGRRDLRLTRGLNGDESILTDRQQRTLYEAMMVVERMFNQEIEPDARHAVDVEWVVQGGRLQLVQGRVLNG